MTDAITKTTLAQLVEALETCITVTTGPGMSEQLYNVPKVIKAISDGKAALAAPQPMVTPYISQAHFDRVFPPEPQPVKQANDWEIRGKLTALKCWHRLTEAEADDLVVFTAMLTGAKP